ncbi:hypothetical protein CARUB_v10024613mg [Capsella rubella]|uniref:Mitochondrial glycoprotein family protein n=1 Tax=Capsella rubella TaxID=81985 RepID=R0FZ83_9BRAS|nr:uncharacterized protein At2g39795, mitochondrial [Capsella rubella]EOA28407.1 hypothetical protein CARUB_v10024613mg [Capsella rubella]
MALALCAVRRSASKFASVCGGRVQMISAAMNRPSLALNPSQLRPFVSRSFSYPMGADQLNSEQTLIREIDSEINSAYQINDDTDEYEETTPEILPFRIEDDGGKTVTLTRDYEGEHIKVVVGMPGETLDPSYYGNGDHDYKIPLTVNVTKKSGLSLQFRCTVMDDDIEINDVFVDQSGDSLKDQREDDERSSDFKDAEYKLRMAFHDYLETRLTKGTSSFLYEYMTSGDKRRHLLWLKDIKTFLDDQS